MYSRKSAYTEKAASTGPFLYSSVIICSCWDGRLYERLPAEGDPQRNNISSRNKANKWQKSRGLYQSVCPSDRVSSSRLCTSPRTLECPAYPDRVDEFHSRDARRERCCRVGSLSNTLQFEFRFQHNNQIYFASDSPTLEPYSPPVTSPFFVQNSQAEEG